MTLVGDYCGEADAVGGYILFSITRASHIFLFARDPAAGKRMIRSPFGDVVNVGAEKSCFPGTYEPVKNKYNSIGSFFVSSITKSSITNAGAGKSHVTRSYQ